MLRIQYLDKDRFMRQVAASKGSVYLHLDNGETCDLKQDSATTELFQMMNAPAKGFSISVADPADVTGLPALYAGGRPQGPRLLNCHHLIHILQQNERPAPAYNAPERAFRLLCCFTGCSG